MSMLRAAIVFASVATVASSPAQSNLRGNAASALPKNIDETQGEAADIAQQLTAQNVPSWCDYVPAQFRGAACRGSNATGCSCQSFCQSTPQSSWSQNPECCGCVHAQGAVLAQVALPAGSNETQGEAADIAQQLTAQNVPSWCDYVPAQFRGAACRGSNATGCSCQSFCQSTPQSSWSQNPECCGCAGYRL